MKKCFIWSLLFSFCGPMGMAFGGDFVVESARSLPVVQDVDVVVVGGSSGAVSAALKAKEAGASVFLIAPRPYLGEDMAGKLRLRQEPGDDDRSALKQMMFTASHARPALPFEYQVSISADKAHPDPQNKRLADGKYLNSSKDSIQYSGDVTISIDLREVCNISDMGFSFFQRLKKNGFTTESVSVRGKKADGTWSAPVVCTERNPDQCSMWEAFEMKLPFSGKYRYVEVVAKKSPKYSRQLLGELRFYSKDESGQAKLAASITPLQVKRTLDAVMLKEKIPFLTGSQVCGTVQDQSGALAGVVMINRSGRQVVKAKVVIDASERGLPARSAGAKATPFPAGNYTFTRTVVAGEAPRADGMRVKELLGIYKSHVQKTWFRPKSPSIIDGRMFLCEMKLPMKDGSARSFAEAEQKARDMTFVESQLEAADSLLFTPPDHFYGEASSQAPWEGVDKLDLRVFQPSGVQNLFVLSGLADVSREAAERLMQPGNLMKLGERIGTEAATMAKRRPAIGAVQLSGVPVTGATGTFVGEHSKALPPFLTNSSEEAKSSQQKLPVLASCDVLVAGAGTGGAPAGIAASRQGVKTIICEYLNQMGGVQTDGLIGYYYFGNRVGFTKEIDKGTGKTGIVFSQSKAEWYRKSNRQANAEIWFGTMVTGVVVENNAVTGVIVVAPDGQRGVIRCKVAIDSTGNAELPAMAGEKTEFITAAELAVQGVGQAPKNMGVTCSNTDIGFLDDTDAADLCFFAIRSRLSMNPFTWDQAQVLGSRERRRIVGAFYMSPLDVINMRTYPDVIVQTYSNFDSHGETVHDQFFIDDPRYQGMYVNLPYRCLLPKKVEGLLVTGLGISAHRDAMPILRMQPDIQNQGYAAGVAAAMAVKANVPVRNIDIKALQRHLIAKKILPKEVLTMKDSFPYPDSKFDEAVQTLPNEYKGLAVLMLDYNKSIPKLQKAFRETTDSAAKFVYAHVLAMMGKADGEDLLIEKLQSSSWDKGWKYRAYGQFHRCVSWIDSYVIALGRCHSKKAVPALIEKANQITINSEFSHFRAIAMSLEQIGDSTAAPALARILRIPGIAGYSIKMSPKIPVVPKYANQEGDKERNNCLRELAIGRALYNLGDVEGMGKKTLEAYANDPRGAYASHAKLVLGKK